MCVCMGVHARPSWLAFQNVIKRTNLPVDRNTNRGGCHRTSAWNIVFFFFFPIGSLTVSSRERLRKISEQPRNQEINWETMYLRAVTTFTGPQFSQREISRKTLRLFVRSFVRLFTLCCPALYPKRAQVYVFFFSDFATHFTGCKELWSVSFLSFFLDLSIFNCGRR